MTPAGYACNKHMRCLTYEEQGAALRHANTQILNLLAIIHRDGGHHTDSVGIDRAIADAEQVLYKWRDAYDALDLVGHPIEWQGRMDAAVAAERELSEHSSGVLPRGRTGEGQGGKPGVCRVDRRARRK